MNLRVWLREQHEKTDYPPLEMGIGFALAGAIFWAVYEVSWLMIRPPC